MNSLNSNHQANLTYNSSNNQNPKALEVSLEAKETSEKLKSNKSLNGDVNYKRVNKPNLLNIYIHTNTNKSNTNSYNNFSNTASSKCLNFNYKKNNNNEIINKENKFEEINDNLAILTSNKNINSNHTYQDNIKINNKYTININNKSNTQTLLSEDTNTEKSLNSGETYFINIKNYLEKNENIFIDPVIRDNTIVKFNLTESEKLLEQKYNFFEEENHNQEKIIIDYKLKTLNQNFYFGDLALDSTKKKRTATVKGGEEDSILGFIPKDIYHYYIYLKKQQIIQNNLHILNDLSIFKSIKSSTFQKFYFPLFEMFEYTKNEVILEPNDEVNNILILKSGKVEVSFKANIFEIQKLSKSIIDKLRKLNIINDDTFLKYEKEFIQNVSFKEFELNRQKAEKLENNRKHVHLFNMSTGEILGLEPYMLGTKSLFKTITQSEKVKLFSLNLEKLKKIIKLYPECKENLIKITLSKTNAILKRLNTVKVSFLKIFEDHYKQNLDFLAENEKNNPDDLNNCNLFKTNKCTNNNLINFEARKNNKNSSIKLFKESEIICESKIEMEKKFFQKILKYNEIENKKSQEFRILIKERDKLNIGKFWKSKNKKKDSQSMNKNNNSTLNNKSDNLENTNLQGPPRSEKKNKPRQKNFHNNSVNLEDNVLEIIQNDYYKNNLDESARYLVNSPINISPYVVDNLIDENLDSSNYKSNYSFNKNHKKINNKNKINVNNSLQNNNALGETSLHSNLQENSNYNIKYNLKNTKEENRENEEIFENKEDKKNEEKFEYTKEKEIEEILDNKKDKENEDKRNTEIYENKENKEIIGDKKTIEIYNDKNLIVEKIDKKDSFDNNIEEEIEHIKDLDIQQILEEKHLKEKIQERIKNELILIEENSLIAPETKQIKVNLSKENPIIRQIDNINQSNFDSEKNKNSPFKNSKIFEKNDLYEFSFKKSVIENKTSIKVINNNLNSLNNQKIPNTKEIKKKDVMISTHCDNKFYYPNKQNISKEKLIFGESSQENSKIEVNTNSKNTFSTLSKKDEKIEEINIKEIFQLNENQETLKKIMFNVNNSHNNLDSTTSNFEAISPLGFHRNFNRMEKSFRNETKNEKRKSTLSHLFNRNIRNSNNKTNKKVLKNEKFKISDLDRKTFYSSYNDTKKNGFSFSKNNILNKVLNKDLNQKGQRNHNSTDFIRKLKFTNSSVDLFNFNLDSSKNNINNTNSFTNDSKSIFNNIVPVENKGYENKRINHMKVFVNKKNKIRQKNFNYSIGNGKSNENGILERIYISEKKNLDEIKSCSKNSVYIDENIDNNNSSLINPRKSNNSLKNYSLDCNNVKIQNVVLSPGIKFMGKKYENMTDQEKVDEIIAKHHNSYEMQILKNNNFAGDTLYYNNDIPNGDTNIINNNNLNNKKNFSYNFIQKQNPNEFFRSFYNLREQNTNNVMYNQNFYNTSRNFYGNFDKEKENLSINNNYFGIIKDFNVSNNNVMNKDSVKINNVNSDDRINDYNKNVKNNMLKCNGVVSNFDINKQKDFNEIVEEKYNSEKSINNVNDKNNQNSEQVINSNKKSLKNNQEIEIGLFSSEDEDIKYNEEEILKENDFINNNSNKKLKIDKDNSNTKEYQSSDFLTKKTEFNKSILNKSKTVINNKIESFDIKSSLNDINMIKYANHQRGLHSRSKSMAFDADHISEITNNNFYNIHPNKFMLSTMKNFRKTYEINPPTNYYGNFNNNPNIISDNNRENFLIPNPNFLNSAYTNFFGTTNINQFISSGNLNSNSINFNYDKNEILSVENDFNNNDNKNKFYKNNLLLNNENRNFSLLKNICNNNRSQLPIILNAKDDLINSKNVNFKNLNNINVISNFMIDKLKNKGVSKNIHDMRNRNHEIKLRKLFNMNKNKL